MGRVTAADDPAVRLHDVALELAVGAARVVRDAIEDRSVTSGSAAPGGQVERKSTPTDLVTATDRSTERWIVERLGELRPGDAVLGEEGGSDVTGPASGGAVSRVRWVVDPIDGTVNFVLGLPQFAVSVAAEIDGVVVAGAVAAPATGEVFHARRGGGAWLGGIDGGAGDRRLGGPRRIDLARAVIATGFGYDADRRARQAAVVAPLLPRIGDLRRLGSAALDLCFVAAGRVDGYFEAGLNPWDHAAGALIAREAGCVVSGVGGAAESAQLLVAAGAELIDELAPVLAELGADRVVMV